MSMSCERGRARVALRLPNQKKIELRLRSFQGSFLPLPFLSSFLPTTSGDDASPSHTSSTQPRIMVETHIPSLPSDQSPHIQSLLSYPASTPHLNRFNLAIQTSTSGRGVYTTTNPLPANTLIEISPVLLFPPTEYARYGSKTQLDGYTFVWKRTGEGAVMALALGLGSLFNHSKSPNVKWVLDHASHAIRYTTVREVGVGEELTISYGAGRMWWEPETEEQKAIEEEERRRREDVGEEARQMALMGLSDNEDDTPEVGDKSIAGEGRAVNGIEHHLTPGPSRPAYPPIYRLTSALDPVTLPLTTRDAWLIDIPPTSASLAVKFLQRHPSVLQNRDDGLHSTRHLRSFRTTVTPHPDGAKTTRTQFLLCLHTALPDRTTLVEWLVREGRGVFGDDPQPYVGKVPGIAAPTKERLGEWQKVWPCIVRTNPKELVPGSREGPVLLVDRKKDAQMWTGEGKRLRWATNRFKRVVALARHAKEQGGIASAVHVTHPFNASEEEREACDWSRLTGPTAPLVGRSTHQHPRDTLTIPDAEWAAHQTSSSNRSMEVDALDSRLHLRNPLKHAVITAISRISLLRSLDRTTSTPGNGSDYLLTGLSLFTLHEPCVYCTMALVHSRVSEVYFLLPSPGRGGCCGTTLPEGMRCEGGEGGGVYALQEQRGLNHSFAVWRWMGAEVGEESVEELREEFELGLLDP